MIINKNILVNNFGIINKIKNDLTKKVVLVLGGYLFLILMSQIKIYLPNNLVPITGQTLAIILIGLSFSTELSAATITLYIFSGAIGLPVFAGFQSGLVLFKPTGGYIIGFFVATQLCGYFAQKGWSKSIIKLVFIIFLAHLVIYFFGVIQLSLFIGLKNSILKGVLPFIIGDIIKSIVAISLLKVIWQLVDRK